MNARRWLVGAVLAVSACLPKEDSREYPCAVTAQCASEWECVDGVCRKGCVGAGDCSTPGWSETAFTCNAGHCVPVTSSNSSSGPSSSGTGSSSGASSAASSSGGSGGSSGVSSSGGSSSSSSSGASSGGGGYSHTILTVTGGGGVAHGNTYTLQLSVGQPVASNPVNNPNGSKLSLGLFSTRGVP